MRFRFRDIVNYLRVMLLPKGWYIVYTKGWRRLYWDKGGWYSEEWFWVPNPIVRFVLLKDRRIDRSGINAALAH